MKKNILILLFSPLMLLAQENSVVKDSTTLTRGEIRKARPRFFTLSYGKNSSKFRDFATSPLTYSGNASMYSLGYLRYDHQRESNFYIKLGSGIYQTSNEAELSQSQVTSIFIGYSRLYQLNKFSNEKWNYKVGGVFDVTGNIRMNSSLQNNAAGIEMFNTLFVSGKVTRDVSRKVNKDKKFLFIKYKRKPRNMWLSYRLNVALMNNTLRNGYIYTSTSVTANTGNILSGYEYKIFSGFRMSAAFDYTVEIKNASQLRFSYLWDAYTTGGDYDKFMMANHVLQASFLFNF